jgi:hypothetical protein
MLSKFQLSQNINNFKKRGDAFLKLVDAYIFYDVKTYEDENAVILAIFQKNLNIFKTIHLLIDGTNVGAPIMILSRAILESMINIEYIQLDDINTNLKLFKNFEIADAMQDVVYLRSKNVDVTALNANEIEKIYNENKSYFERPDGEIWRSWSHRSFEQMLDDVIRKRNFSQTVKDTIVSTYIQSNRVAHLSPSQVKLYLLGEKFVFKDLHDTSLGYISALTAIIRITSFLSERFGIQKLEKSLDELFSNLDNDIIE